MRTIRLILSLVALGFYASASAEAPRSLAQNDHLPAQAFEFALGADAWKVLKDHPYEGYVIADCRVRDDGYLSVRKVMEAFPDSSWVKQMPAVLKEKKLSPLTTGSYMDPSARVWVVFYREESGLLAIAHVQINESSRPHKDEQWTFFARLPLEKGPNQPPEPTAMSVTPPAAQEPRQP